jgi:hypothetical protein
LESTASMIHLLIPAKRLLCVWEDYRRRGARRKPIAAHTRHACRAWVGARRRRRCAPGCRLPCVCRSPAVGPWRQVVRPLFPARVDRRFGRWRSGTAACDGPQVCACVGDLFRRAHGVGSDVHSFSSPAFRPCAVFGRSAVASCAFPRFAGGVFTGAVWQPAAGGRGRWRYNRSLRITGIRVSGCREGRLLPPYP